MLSRARVADVGQFLIKLMRERAEESKRLNTGKVTDDVKKDIEVMLNESELLTDAFDMCILVGKTLP